MQQTAATALAVVVVRWRWFCCIIVIKPAALSQEALVGEGAPSRSLGALITHKSIHKLECHCASYPSVSGLERGNCEGVCEDGVSELSFLPNQTILYKYEIQTLSFWL